MTDGADFRGPMVVNRTRPKDQIGTEMAPYIDGFVFPISRQHLSEYVRVAAAVAKIYKEHGARDYFEFVGDDMARKGTRPFPELVSVGDDETVVFGWVVFDSRETRDLVNEKVESDPRMAELVAPLMNPAALIFDASRMAYGGFRSLVNSEELPMA